MQAQHREIFSTYWAWSHDWLARALDTGIMRTVFGWTCATGVTEFNERSIMNWPAQATSADILRLVVVWATRRGLRLLAPVHDAILLEAPLDRIEHDVALLREIMMRASRVVLNDTATGDLALRTDATIVRYPDRYKDPRGEAIWLRVMELLAEGSGGQRRSRRPAMDDSEPWYERRLRELEAATPVKRKKPEPFVQVPLWWAKQMTAATHTKRALVGIVLLHTAWKTKRTDFPAAERAD